MVYVFKIQGKKRWRYRYKKADGRKGFGIGLTSKRETEQIAMRRQTEEEAIARGWKKAPKPSDTPRNALETMQEYLDWGKTQGGRRGHGWGERTAIANRSRLLFWKDELGLKELSDLMGTLPIVEKSLRLLKEQGRSGKTLQHYASILNAFCNWCCERSRGYLDENPLKGMTRFDTTPITQRRAMTREEIRKLLEAAPPHRKLAYELALSTGLRAKELLSLRGKHLDMKWGGIHLEAKWTKNRKNGFINLDNSILTKLQEVAEVVGPEGQLVYVSTHPSRELAKDLKKAVIPRFKLGEGKIDFHSLRVAFGTMLADSGCTAKELKELMRHSTLEMTDRYLRVRSGRLEKAAKDIGKMIRGDK